MLSGLSKTKGIVSLFGKIILLTLLTGIYTLKSQNEDSQPVDTLNKLNANKKKTGYWSFYLDANYNKCPKKGAKYIGFMRYTEGKTQVEPVARDNKKDRMFYQAFNDSDALKRPTLLNGELFTFNITGGKEKLRYSEVYKNGMLATTKEYFFQDNDSLAEINICYYDSLYSNNQFSYLFYKVDKNIPLYKQYVGRKKNLSNINFLVKHHDFKYKYRPIVGFNVNLDKPTDKTIRNKNFIELGVTRRYYKSVYIDTTKKTYHDKFGIWHAFNFSLMGSTTNGKFCLGQKLTYSYTFAVLRAEAGIVNYTDFTKTDLRLMAGFGLSAIGYFNEMIEFSVPITQSPFKDIGRVTLVVFFN